MGQKQGTPAHPDEEESCELPYGSRSLVELQHIALERGLVLDVADRSALLALLQAYDVGAQSAQPVNARKGSKSCPTTPGGRESIALDEEASDETVVQRILSAPGLKGVDIGGSLAKMVLAMPRSQADGKRAFPEAFGATGRTRYDLELDFDFGSEPYSLKFFSGATAQVTSAVTSVQEQHQRRRGRRYGSSGGSAGARSEAETETEENEEPDGSVGHGPATSAQRLFTAGGGAHKFAPLFRDALGVELVPVKELSAVVDGLLFLASLRGAGRREIFALDEAGKPAPVPWPEPLFPFLVVNIGSGVSILRVDSAEEGGYTRVGGTACGGATFLGLARAMTSAQTFEEALALAEGGDATKCDLLVRDIYGDEGSASLGLPGGLTAANCGRLCEDMQVGSGADDGYSEQDLARSLLQMVTQQAVLLSGAFARHAGCVDRVFFAGGFLEEGNHIARKAIAANLRSLGGRAYFLRHSDFLGALGSLRSCMQATGRDTLAAPLALHCSSLLAAEKTSVGSPSWSTASTSSTCSREGL